MAVAPTYFLDPADVTARNAEYTGTPFTDTTGDGTYATPYLGVNRGGSNAPGIGMNPSTTPGASDGAVDANDWTVLDQAGAARNPQDGQQIGGSGFVDRSSVAYDSSGGAAGAGTVPFNIMDAATPDTNNTCVLTNLAVAWVTTAFA